jgi:hypothetical protein
MSNSIPPAAPKRTTGLSPKEQKLQALREKLAKADNTAKPVAGHTTNSVKAKTSFAGKKTLFNRKAV